MTVAVATRRLPSGACIPVIGLGVYESVPGDETYNSVLTALKLGYRHVDTARFYQNEADVYRAIVDSGVPREEVFVTSKVFSIEAWTYDSVVEAAKISTANLGGYVDLYLLHAPGTSEGRDDAWRALEDLQKEGVLRDIGVSNFGEAHLEKLAKTWHVKPAVNQIELSPWLMRADLVKYCESQSILLQAFSPLTRAKKLNDPVLVSMASEVNASPAQVLIAWSIAKGFVTLPKSVKEHRLKENLEAHDVRLSGEHVTKLDSPDDYFLSSFLNGRPFDPIKDSAV